MDGSRARALLGVPAHATGEQVRAAFRRAARRAHPDGGGDEAWYRSVVAARDALLAAPAPAPRRPAGAWDVSAPRPALDVRDVPRPRPVAPTPDVADFEAILARALAA